MKIMKSIWNKNFILTLLIARFSGFPHQVFNIVFPVYILDIGSTNIMTGNMLLGLTIATLITRLFFGYLPDTFGRKKTMVLGSTLFMVNTLAYCFIDHITGLFILRICNGISQGIFFPVPPTIVADVVDEDHLVDAMGIFGISGSLPVAFAPTFGLWFYQSFGANALFLLSTFTSGMAVLFALMINDTYQPVKHIKTKLSIDKVIEVSALIPCFIYFFVFIGNSAIINFLSPCGLARGIENIGLFFTVNTLVVIVARLVTGRISRRFGMNKTLLGGILISAFATLMIAFSYHIVMMIIWAIMLGFGITIVGQIIQVQILSNASEHRKGVANTTFMLFGDIGNGLGAVLWGSISESFGYVLTYSIASICMFGGAIVNRLTSKS